MESAQSPITLGSHKINFPYFLAPMAGITNAPFRLLMKELGAGCVISELISATGIQYAGAKTLELCQYFEEERPIGLQIFGENASHLAEAAQFLEKRQVDFIDINLGCPVPKVVSKGAGAAMLKDPMHLYQTLEAVKKSIQIPLTIKIRSGWDACSINAIECVHAAAEAGVTWVAIHGRTRAQGYEGLADWDLIARVKERSPIPIIGNGDVLTAAQAIQRKKESNCDGIMIGRGALRSPFIFLEIAKTTNTSSHCPWLTTDKSFYWQMISRHIELLTKSFRPFYAGVQLRKFMTWYSAGIEGAAAFRKKLYEIPTTADQVDEQHSNLNLVIELGREFFDKPELQKQNSFLKDPFLKGGHG